MSQRLIGETNVIFFDETYWLNRLVKNLIKTETKSIPRKKRSNLKLRIRKENNNTSSIEDAQLTHKR